MIPRFQTTMCKLVRTAGRNSVSSRITCANPQSRLLFHTFAMQLMNWLRLRSIPTAIFECTCSSNMAHNLAAEKNDTVLHHSSMTSLYTFFSPTFRADTEAKISLVQDFADILAKFHVPHSPRLSFGTTNCDQNVP